jgi:hypothetical protein
MFSDYNHKVATTTCSFLIQPPWYISRMMEPLSHYHCEIYCCKLVPINLDQKTYTNNLNHTSIMNQPIPQPVIKLYHKQVYQPCTNLYQTTCNQPNHIYSPRSITKTTLKDVHKPSITKQLIIITKINMCF